MLIGIPLGQAHVLFLHIWLLFHLHLKLELTHRKCSRKYLWPITQQMGRSFIHSFTYVRNKELSLSSHAGLSPSLLGVRCVLSLITRAIQLGGSPDIGTCAASDDILCPMEAFFPTKRLVIMSLFAAIDGRTHKPLTSSRPGVRPAWILSRGILARKNFQNSGSASAAKGGGLGGQGPHTWCWGRAAGERPVPGGVGGLIAGLPHPSLDHLCFLSSTAFLLGMAFWHVLIINCPLVHSESSNN